jgi:hypothetical protein
MIRSIRLLLFLILTVTLAGSAVSVAGTTPPDTGAQFTEPPDDLRDHRYCEVIAAFRSGLKARLEVYTTFGLNSCPGDLWDELDEDALAEELDAKAVKFNGPRYWVVNSVESGEDGDSRTVDFGGIEMALSAVMTMKGRGGQEPYSENTVKRTRAASFIYLAGNEVYELTSPEGDVYRMQSYSQVVDPSLAIDDLKSLGDRLELPEGWTFQARVLTEDSELMAEEEAYVVTDDLKNTYQRVRSHD